MGVDFKIEKDNTKEVLSAEEKAVLTALTEIGLLVEGDAKMKAPVDTGNLRNSITNQVERGERAVYIGTPVEYAPYVEYGHRVGTSNAYVPPNPFLMPAVEDNQNEIKQIIEENLGKS